MRIEAIHQGNQALVLDYQLTPAQLRYTGTPELPIQLSQTYSFIHPFVGIDKEAVTNFFVLDEKKDVALYTDNPQAILLRSFSTDCRHLNKGYAKSVMLHLPNYVKQHFPDCNEIVLAVNQQNTLAQKLYQTCGFTFTNREVLGDYGLLLIMNYAL